MGYFHSITALPDTIKLAFCLLKICSCQTFKFCSRMIQQQSSEGRLLVGQGGSQRSKCFLFYLLSFYLFSFNYVYTKERKPSTMQKFVSFLLY